jgi:hypothetical protein
MLPIGSVGITTTGYAFGGGLDHHRRDDFSSSVGPDSLGHRVHFEIALRRNAKGIGHTIEEGKHGGDVHRLCDLRFGPAMVAKKLYILVCGSIRRLGNPGDIREESSLRVRQVRFVESSLNNRLYRFVVGSLNPQEVCMGVQSIGTAIEPGDPAGDGFFSAAGEVAF